MSGHHKWSELKQKSRGSLTRYAHDEYGYISEDGKRIDDEPPMCLASEVDAALLAAREERKQASLNERAAWEAKEVAEASLSRLREQIKALARSWRRDPRLDHCAHALEMLTIEPQTEKP